MSIFKGLKKQLENAVQNIQEEAQEKTIQLGISEEATAMNKLNKAEDNLNLLKNIDEPIKNLQYNLYLKNLMIQYLKQLNFNKDSKFRLIEDVNTALKNIDNDGYQSMKNKNYDNSILIGIPVILQHDTGGNNEFKNQDFHNFNYIKCNKECPENNFTNNIYLNQYSNNDLEIYKKYTTIENINQIKEILNTDSGFTNFEQTTLFDNLLGDNSQFKNKIGYYDSTKSDTYVYFRINFESSVTYDQKIENFTNSEYMHFILNKYDLTSRDIDNKINKNKELILIEQNKYNIKMGIFKILKYISIILTILLIFII
jgi:hypothetical protein